MHVIRSPHPEARTLLVPAVISMERKSPTASATLRRSLTLHTLALTTSLAAAAAIKTPTDAKLKRHCADESEEEEEESAIDVADDEDREDRDDVESTKRLTAAQQLEILRGKLARRNKILEVVRRAYYHDVIVVKEELRHARHQSYSGGLVAAAAAAAYPNGSHTLLPPSSSRSTTSSNAPSGFTALSSSSSLSLFQGHDDRLSSVPSIDLRDVLPLFAPAETVLKVHPCETCGGHLELVHGESKELHAARQEVARATKSEQQIKTLVHRLRTEAKEKEDLNEALQQRVKSLVKENSYTLEQLQASRKMERDQKTLNSNLRSKLQLAQATQEDLDLVTVECKDVKQQLVRSNHDRDIFSASNNHLKEELAEISKTLHQAKVDHAQLESDFGATSYKLQEELKKTKQLREELASECATLKDKTKLSNELQQSLTALKGELAITMRRADQMKRQLEDQLADEEKAREEAQEQNLEFRRINKKLLRDLEQIQRDPLGLSAATSMPVAASHGDGKKGHGGKATASVAGGEEVAVGSAGRDGLIDVRTMIRKKIEDSQRLLEHALMREHDLLGQATRQKAQATPPPLREKLTRMPSTTTITRVVAPEMASAQGAASAGSKAAAATTWETRPKSSSSAGQIAEADGDGSGGIDEKAFQAYHQELHRLVMEIETGKDVSQKQQKVITEVERKNQALLDRLEEAKLAIETLTGSVAALKTRLNQDSAGAAEHLENMMRALGEGKRDQQHENERGLVLLHFLRTISNYAYELCTNQALVVEFDLDRPPVDHGMDESDAMLSPELLQRKRELRKKVLMDRAMQKFSQQCHQRAELVASELKKMVDTVERLRFSLDEAENKIDSDQLVIRSLEAETSKLQLTVEVTKTNLSRSEKALKQTREELEEALGRYTVQTEELKLVKAENVVMKSDSSRLAEKLFEKTKAWEKEINANDKTTRRVSVLEVSVRELSTERDALANKLQEMEDLAQWKQSTNKEVGVMAAPEVQDMDMQTDRWRPQGLILRQRNDPTRMPQRYLGKASVTISCGPSLLDSDALSSAALAPLRQASLGASLNQTSRPLTAASSQEPWAELDERARDMIEFDLYPPAKAGGRQIKTSQATTRPRNLSRLFLSSDGVSQKYIAPANLLSSDLHTRPSTTI